MIRPRLRKVLTDLWGNKTRSLLVIASITIGLFAVGLITSMHIILTEDMRASYAEIHPANIIVQTTGFDEYLLDRVRGVEGVAQADGIYTLSAQARTRTGESIPIGIVAVRDVEDWQINQVHPEQGEWPPGEREIVVDHYKYGDLQTSLGESVEIELPSGAIRELPLVGVVHDQTIGASEEGGGYFLSPVQAYTTLETLPWLEQPEIMTRLLVTVEDEANDKEHLRKVASRVTDELENADITVLTTFVRGSNDHPNRSYVEAIASVLFLLGMLVMFLSAFLITNTLSALLTQQVNQIGIMKSVGARRGQIIGIYLLLILIFSLLAFALALPLSTQVAYSLLDVLAGQVNVILRGIRIVPLAALLMLVMALIVPQAAAFYPIWHGTRVTVVEALSGISLAQPSGKKSWLDARLHAFRGVSRPLLISLRNTFRRKGRLALTLITLTLGGAIFIATFNVQGSLNRYIERIGKYFLADVNVTLGSYERIEEVEGALSGLAEVQAVEGWAFAGSELVMPDGSKGEAVSLLAPPVGSPLVEPIVQEGRWIEAGDENALAVNERFRETFPDLQVGDRLRLKIAGDEYDFTVVGFFQLAGRTSGYLAYTGYDYLSELTGHADEANAFRITANRPGLTLEEQKALGRQVEAHLEGLGYKVVDVEGGQSLTETTTDGLTILTGFLLIMASLIAIVGSIGLTGTLSMNVLERTREIGIMRSIGANNRTLVNLVMVEGMLIGVISWLLGTLLAFPISILLSNAINFALFGASVPFSFTPAGVFIWMVVVLTLSALASVIPARSSSRLTIREVLAYE